MKKQYTMITGASAGIGKALAMECAKHGENLILIARSADKLENLCDGLTRQYGVEAHFIPADLLQEDAPDKIMEYVRSGSFTISVLINNAGMGDACLFENSGMEKDENIIRLNVLALMKMNRLFIPYMKKTGTGVIANIASTLAFAPTAGEAVYAASKAFVLSFSQALYEETKESGVSVLTICPGVTNTDFFKSAGFTLGQFRAAAPEDFAKYAYQCIQKKKALSVHRFTNKATALFSRLVPRSIVRKVFSVACRTNK